MSHCNRFAQHCSRRDFLSRTSLGLGAASLATLVDPRSLLAEPSASLAGAPGEPGGILGRPHFPARAKRVIYLFQSGAPSQFELFDPKPMLNARQGEELPDSIRAGQRLTGMSSGQASFPLVGSIYRFDRHGESGAPVSELMPHTAGVVDELCFVRSMYTEAINHDPASTFVQTGSQFPGRPSIGSWVSCGLGSDNQDLPAFCVLLSAGIEGMQPLYARLWGNGFLPSQTQGAQFRSGKDPVLYLNNPEGISDSDRRRQLDTLERLQRIQRDDLGDPEIDSKIAQYEMAYRMQASVPATMDITGEPEHVYEMYGPESRTPGTFAANCLLARRLAERDVRFIQLYHQGWDQHGNLNRDVKVMAQSTDQASAALVLDLKQRGLLDDTLVIWGGEFGRTNYSQGNLASDGYGRDHHPRCFTVWMAGAGVKAGFSYGETDELGYNITRDPVHVHDLQATLLHLLGIDHERLTFRHRGRRFRLTDVHGEVVKALLA